MGESTDLSNKLEDSAAVKLTGKIMVAVVIVLFLVVVFVFFVHVCAKWFRWRMEDPSHPSRHSLSGRHRRFVFAPGQDPALATLRRGLDPTVLRSFPVVVFRPEEFKEGLECAVCLSVLVQGEKARMVPKCNHGFHVECIDMWFQSHSTCPLCRNSVAAPPLDTSNSGSLAVFSPPLQDSSGAGGYSTETPNFPTDLLFGGNQTQGSSKALCLDEGSSSQSPCLSSSSTSLPSTNSPDGMLVIDIHMQTAPAEISSQFLPMPTRLLSLKRLLSREKRVVACSS